MQNTEVIKHEIGEASMCEYYYKFLVMIIILLLLSSCSFKNPTLNTQVEETAVQGVSDKQFVSSVYEMEIEDVNRSISIELSQDPELSSNPSTIIYLSVENKTDEAIQFPAGFDSKIFRFSNNEWVPIQNTATYSGDKILLSVSSFYGISTILPIVPLLDDPDEENLLRVTIMGESLIDGETTGKKVSAYVDITIDPSQPNNPLSENWRKMTSPFSKLTYMGQVGSFN